MGGEIKRTREGGEREGNRCGYSVGLTNPSDTSVNWICVTVGSGHDMALLLCVCCLTGLSVGARGRWG